MDFLDNVMKSSNALLKEHLNNPFSNKQPKQEEGGDQQSPSQGDQDINTNATNTTTTTHTSSTHDDQPPPQPLNSGASAANPTIGSSNGETPLSENSGADRNSQFAAIAADAEAVTQKAVKGAKNIGSFLFSMANKAGQTVQQTAKQVKQAVENTSILTEFTREQQEFIKEHGGSMQAGELPWSNCSDESKSADMREQILSLSQDRRNFVRGPPSDASFQFDPQQGYPIALTLLREDPNLSKMRFELVPKLVNEDTFWRNYFYRVHLLKQMSDRGEDMKRQGWSSSRSSSGEGPDEITTTANTNEETTIATTLGEDTQINNRAAQQSFELDTKNFITTPFESSTTQELESSESRKLVAEADDLKSKLKELNIGSFDGGSQDDQTENEKWEEELQRDLQEFELVSGDVSALDEEALDKDIMELKKSVKDTK